MDSATPDYGYSSSDHSHTHDYLLDPVLENLRKINPKRIFEVGCGNGSLTHKVSEEFAIIGIDSSQSGIRQAKIHFPSLEVFVGSAYDDLSAEYGEFDAVISLEVIEHLYDPRKYLGRIWDLLEPGGSLILTTPYHGYLKNVALAISGKMDDHFTALWDGGHIKFWSRKTLTLLLEEIGFIKVGIERVGRLPLFAKSMVATAQKPI